LFDYLQVPSSHFIGLSTGQISYDGQLNGSLAHDPSGHLYGVLA